MRDYRRYSDKLIAQFSGRYRRRAKKVARDVQKYLGLGYDPTNAVGRAFDKHKIEAWMMDNVTDSVVKSALYGYGTRPTFALLANEGLTSKLLELSYDGSKTGLSERIHRNVTRAKKTITSTLKTAMQAGQTVRDLAQELFDGYGYGQRIDMPGAEVNRQLQKLAAAEKTRIRELKRAGVQGVTPEPILRKIRRLEAYTDDMSKTNLRTSYKQLIRSIEAQNAKALEKAVYVAVQEKARSQALMVAQTEISCAYGAAFESRAVQDPDVVGIGYSLSPSHDIFDICDFHTSADFGYGPGIYPLDSVPEFPFHPRCNCRMEEVFRGELPEDARIDPVREEQGATRYLNRLPKEKRRELMGVQGNSEFTDQGRWRNSLRQYRGHREAQAKLKTSDFIPRPE